MYNVSNSGWALPSLQMHEKKAGGYYPLIQVTISWSPTPSCLPICSSKRSSKPVLDQTAGIIKSPKESWNKIKRSQLN
jgi:hypothetical protein